MRHGQFSRRFHSKVRTARSIDRHQNPVEHVVPPFWKRLLVVVGDSALIGSSARCPPVTLRRPPGRSSLSAAVSCTLMRPSIGRPFAEVDGPVRERDLDALRVERLLDAPAELPRHGPLLERLCGEHHADADGRVPEVVDAEYMASGSRMRWPSTSSFSSSSPISLSTAMT